MNGADRRPSVSAIVTNYNYGHFLDACLDSLVSQTHQPVEIIVVDDHSTDSSDKVLERRKSEITLLRTQSRGQAAAFNLGFSAASGDVIVFVDADDMLLPDALEVALDYWADDLALLSFGLEQVDASGRGIGLHPYSLAADDGDNRPRLLRNRSVSGPFLFSPTTGNLFSRAFLQAALPMPEPGWRICADAYLVRAAALWGRSRTVPRILGSYRMHGGNNYIRPDNFDTWSTQRSLRDIDKAAQALEELARWDGVPERGDAKAILRLALRLRALENRANGAAWTGEYAPFRKSVADAAKATLSEPGLSIHQRLAAAVAVRRYGRKVLRTYTTDPAHEAAPVQARPLPIFPVLRHLSSD